MNRSKFRKTIIGLSVFVIIIFSIEGLLYYSSIQNAFFRVTLTVQNMMKAFSLSPYITQTDALTIITNDNLFSLTNIITYLYCLAIVIAPFCSLGFITMLLDKPINYIYSLFKKNKPERMLIWGEGGEKTLFINALMKELRLTVVEPNFPKRELELQYIRNKISYAIYNDDLNPKTLFKEIKLRKYKSILLCDDDSIKNMLTLKLILDFAGDSWELNNLDIYIICDDHHIKELISEYFKNNTSEDKKLEFINLKLIDPKEKAIQEHFKTVPLCQVNTKDKLDVHVAILGFGALGRHALLQSLNQGVLASNSKILIDVFDHNIDDTFAQFAKNFSHKILDNLEYRKKEICIGKAVDYYVIHFSQTLTSKDKCSNLELFGMDGEVELRFWRVGVETLSFRKILEDCNREMSFTYAISAFTSDKTSLDAVFALNQSLSSNGTKIPVLIRHSNSSNLKEILENSEAKTKLDYHLINEDEKIYSLASLKNSETEEQTNNFHKEYCLFYDKLSKNKCNATEFIEKEYLEAQKPIETLKTYSSNYTSTLAQVLASCTWKKLIEKNIYYYDPTNSSDNDNEELQKMEHRRWCLFMITQGYTYGEKKDTVIHKTHPNLCDWNTLKQTNPQTLAYDAIPFEMLH